MSAVFTTMTTTRLVPEKLWIFRVNKMDSRTWSRNPVSFHLWQTYPFFTVISVKLIIYDNWYTFYLKQTNPPDTYCLWRMICCRSTLFGWVWSCNAAVKLATLRPDLRGCTFSLLNSHSSIFTLQICKPNQVVRLLINSWKTSVLT